MTSSILLLTEVPRGLRGNLHRTDPLLRSLDAIHVATAVQLRPLLDAFVSYDHRQAAVAREVGLRVVSPGA
jgi:predicted nucleic acid-binding protein